MLITAQDIANFNIESNAPLSTEQILSRLIKEDEKSSLKHEMEDGERYDDSKHDILDEDFTSITSQTSASLQNKLLWSKVDCNSM